MQKELKRTQNETQFIAEMGASCLEFELSDTSHVLAKASIGKRDLQRNRPGGGIQGTARNYKNRGNEAKEYLKTKDITFSNAANHARFARELAAIRLQKGQTTAYVAKTKSELSAPGAMP